MTDQDPVAWLRKAINQRLYLARRPMELGNAAVWHEPSSGVLVTGEPTETDAWYGTWSMGDSSLARLMEANDPQDTIVRCEAELAILDEHAPEWADYADGDGTDRTSLECKTCEPPGTPDNYPCRTVRLLAGGYRHWPGFREDDWGAGA
jgi:hypothetical protein